MGLVDDFIKLKSSRDGVKPVTKLFFLTILSLGCSSYLCDAYYFSVISIPFMVFLIVASANSMNITDGLDGLALGISIIIFSSIAVIAWHMRREDVLLYSILLLGICFATLIFNIYPAKLFIGDTVSLLLGASVAILLVMLECPYLIILMMGVCIYETLSVIIQLTSKRLFGKKVFLIAPYHHHLEKKGFSERRIVILFWGITLVLCVFSIILVW